MIRDSLAFYIEWFFNEETSDEERQKLLYKINNDLKREFRGIMPRKYCILQTTPKTYLLSHTICMEFPAFGSYEYRIKLNELYNFLQIFFITDKISFDGKVTYQIRGMINDNFRKTPTEFL